MRCFSFLLSCGAIALLALFGCGRGKLDPPTEGPPAPAAAARTGPLTARDVQMYLAVRDRALVGVETALERVESEGVGVITGIQDLAAAEQDAAPALGADWQRYRWVREEVARLLSLQREREDARVLALELGRASDDLRSQLEANRDPAGRQFLEAQLATIDEQLAELAQERELPPVEREQLALIEGVRAEIATHQGRQDRVRRRLRELLEESRAAGSALPVPTGTATPAPATTDSPP